MHCTAEHFRTRVGVFLVDWCSCIQALNTPTQRPYHTSRSENSNAESRIPPGSLTNKPARAAHHGIKPVVEFIRHGRVAVLDQSAYIEYRSADILYISALDIKIISISR